MTKENRSAVGGGLIDATRQQKGLALYEYSASFGDHTRIPVNLTWIRYFAPPHRKTIFR